MSSGMSSKTSVWSCVLGPIQSTRGIQGLCGLALFSRAKDTVFKPQFLHHGLCTFERNH